MLKALVPKFRSDLPVPLRDIAEERVPTKLKPIVGVRRIVCRRCHFLDIPQCIYC